MDYRKNKAIYDYLFIQNSKSINNELYDKITNSNYFLKIKKTNNTWSDVLIYTHILTLQQIMCLEISNNMESYYKKIKT